MFTSPFDEASIEVYFTLASTLTPDILDTYSKFRVRRLFDFNPFEGEAQSDPLLNNHYMLPQDIEIIVILDENTHLIPHKILKALSLFH